jgi:hypothetical protein
MTSQRRTAWILRSGAGYFLGWAGQTPRMTSDPVEAQRMTAGHALGEIAALEQAGFASQPIQVKAGRVRAGAGEPQP